MSTYIRHSSYRVSRIYVNESRFGLCFQTRVGQDDTSPSVPSASAAVSICFKIRKHYSWYSTLEQQQQLQQPISTNDLIFTKVELLATRHVVLLRDSLLSFSAVSTLLTPELDYLGIPQGLQAIAVQKIVSEAEACADIVVDASEHTLVTVTWTHATAYACTEHHPSTSNMITGKANGNCCFREVDHDEEEEDMEDDEEEDNGPDNETVVKEVEEEMNVEQQQQQDLRPQLQTAGHNTGAQEDPLFIIEDEDHEGVWEPPEATPLRMSIIQSELTGNRLPREHLQASLTLVSINSVPVSSDNQEIEVEDLSADESMDNQYNRNGTCPCFIQQLEKIKLDSAYDVESKGPCAICMDKFEVGVDVTRLPCLHIYHGDCIVHWLQKSHKCPLCRSPMPLSRTLPEELTANTLY